MIVLQVLLLLVLILVMILGRFVVHVLFDKSVCFSSKRHNLTLKHFTVILDQIGFVLLLLLTSFGGGCFVIQVMGEKELVVVLFIVIHGAKMS